MTNEVTRLDIVKRYANECVPISMETSGHWAGTEMALFLRCPSVRENADSGRWQTIGC